MNQVVPVRLAALSDENGDLTRAPCPACRASTSDVVDTRPWHGCVKRRRKCRACQHRWSTLEVPFDVTNALPSMEANLRKLSKQAVEMANALTAIAKLVPRGNEEGTRLDSDKMGDARS